MRGQATIQNFSPYLAEIKVRVHLKDPRINIPNGQACTNPGRLVAQAIKFYASAPHIFSIIFAVFPLHTKMFITSHTPCIKRQLTSSQITPELGGWGVSVQNLFRVCLLATTIWVWPLHFRKICGPLVQGKNHCLLQEL